MHAKALRIAAPLAAAAAAASVAAGSAGAATQAAAPAASSGCTLVSTSAGAIDVDAAGLATLHVDPIGLNVQLTGLPGTLLCGLLGGTVGTGGVTGG